MAVVTLSSASGSPGVTTTALGLALLWPRPVLLIEADPTGGSNLLAGYFRGTRQYDAGLIELALTANNLGEALADVAQPIDVLSAVQRLRMQAKSLSRPAAMTVMVSGR